MEWFKLAGAILFGGLAGQVLGEIFRRRGARLQVVTLIERVNRKVNPDLKGIALARVTSSGGSPPKLEEIRDLREYQLTLRNTSKVHLQNVEVQFEFPSEDVQSWASRPALSQTALLPVDATATDPWKRAFRWRIPHLPSGDSVEFTFQAISPESDQFIASLYNAERVIIERVAGEPKSSRAREIEHMLLVLAAVALGALAFVMQRSSSPGASTAAAKDNATQTIGPLNTEVAAGGCNLLIHSGANPDTQWQGIWFVAIEVLNVGQADCTIKWPNVFDERRIAPGDSTTTARYQRVSPVPGESSISVSSAGETAQQIEVRTLMPQPKAAQ